MMPRIHSIFIAAAATVEMQSLLEAQLISGQGVAGDRYALGRGTFSRDLPGPDHELTLIEIEQVKFFNDACGLSLEPGQFRRNVVTEGIDLNGLIDREFLLGDAVIRGLRLCEPCRHLIPFTHPDILPGLRHRGGLRAAILTGGTIRVGDVLRPK